MRAAVYRQPLDIRCERAPDPEPAAGQLLVQVKACGICGSDLHMYRVGGMFEELGRPIGKGRIIIGHEIAGDVVAIGAGVTGFNIGDRLTGIGHGGMAELAPVPVSDNAPHVLPDAIDYDVGATLEPLATSIHAVGLARVAADDRVVILGAGIVGLGCLQVLVAEVGCRPIVIDRSAVRLAMAARLGAGATIDLSAADPVDSLIEVIGGQTPPGIFGQPGGIADVVLDCAGSSESPGQALRMLKPSAGRLVLVGMFEKLPTLDLNQVVRKQANIVGSWIWNGDDYRRAIEFVASGRIDREPLISHRFPLSRVIEAFAAQADVDASIKVVVET